MCRPGHWSIRSTDKGDRSAISQLLTSAERVHLHLDWIDPRDLLDLRPSLIMERDAIPLGCLICPPEPEGVIWLRLFTARSQSSLFAAWEELWSVAHSQAKELGVDQAAAFMTYPWLEPLLSHSGFQHRNDVLFLEWRETRFSTTKASIGRLRAMSPSDLSQIVTVDRRAFRPIWRTSQRVLQEALKQAAYATVIEHQDRIVAYQISNTTLMKGHLARLAVDPDWQGKGIGKYLVADMIQRLSERGIDRVSVNTQADNLSSLELYEKLGFRETGQVFPIFVLKLGD